MFDEAIVCDQCGEDGCTVREIPVHPRQFLGQYTISEVPGMTQDREPENKVPRRAFEITCLRCGHKQRLGEG